MSLTLARRKAPRNGPPAQHVANLPTKLAKAAQQQLSRRTQRLARSASTRASTPINPSPAIAEGRTPGMFKAGQTG
jgi:hypothetical protein